MVEIITFEVFLGSKPLFT